MKKTIVFGLAAAVVLAALILVIGRQILQRETDSATETPAPPPSAATAAHPSFLYGRVTTVGGVTHEGRLRFGRDQEAFWNDYFNGVRSENRWAQHVPPEHLTRKRYRIEFLGVKIGPEEQQIVLRRPFMARFGDIVRIDAAGPTGVRVTLKSGTVTDLNRLDASDFDDGVRVWDGNRVVDLDTKWIRSIELSAPDRAGETPDRLHGTVRTTVGDFTGFVQWDREESLARDELDGRAADEKMNLRFETIRSIARESDDSSRVVLRDGREIVLSGTHDVGHGNRGLYVDDPRYGRVLIAWHAFERVDFSDVGTGPAYDDFPPGEALTGTVTTRDGRVLTGRLVYDLDESETTETLDARVDGLTYTIPFGLITLLDPGTGDESGRKTGTLTLHSGEELQLEHTGDLSAENGGVLIFSEGQERPEYVPWSGLVRIAFDRPTAMYPPIGPH